MRIGILTFHDAHNYGAVLQCYALQEYLKGRGHNVYVIDYRPSSITDTYKWFDKSRIFRKNIFKVFQELKILKGKRERYESFEEFIQTYLSLTPVETIMKNPFDIIIVGSDQVWNYNLTDGFDQYFWGAFPHPEKTKIVSYAASMHDNWQEEKLTIKSLLSNFSRISVRELTLATKLSDLTGREDIRHVLDPTLLINPERWKDMARRPKFKEPFLLLFQVGGSSEKTEKIAEMIAKRKSLSIIHLSTLVDSETPSSIRRTSPTDFIGLFLYADFVVCSSFHGTVFSVLFNKPFVSIRMGVGKDARVASLLQSLGLIDHFVDTVDINNDYSYKTVQTKLEVLKQNSIDFFKDIENRN